MSDSFWYDFLANFLSDLIIGIVFGIILAIWIGKRLNQDERDQQRRDKESARLEKAIQYLECLKEEIEILLAELNRYVGELNTIDLQNSAAILNTAFWDALQPGGELPQILKPDLLKWLTGFYQSIKVTQRGFDLIIETWSDPQCEPTDGVVKITLQGVEKALQYRRLPEKIDSEILELEKYKR